MVKEDLIELQKVQQPIEWNERKESISGIGYVQRPLNARTQTNQKYLDYAFMYGDANITGTSVGEVTYTPSTTDIIPFETIGEKRGNYKREISPSGGIIIPTDGTYVISMMRIFNMAGNTSGKTSEDIVAEFGNKALLAFASQAESETGTKQFIYYSSKRFDLATDIINFSFSGNFSKGSVLRIQGAHKRDGVIFPIINSIYITKTS